jgi:dihydrodiol dehydrogenase / D-xylose 1-dehydrogenase (NADP)
MDDPSVKDPLQCPPLRWGMLGCGRVSHDFTQALKYLPSQTVVACSARSEDSAKKFAEKHGINKYYGSYDAMLQDPEVDIVYVGNVHSLRRSTGERCLLANKHVLLEKPFACSVEDGEYLIGLAKERNLFLMEGMWTRFFPAVQKARELALGTGSESSALGEIAKVYSDFNFQAGDSDEYPTSFLYQPQLGGGSSLLVAPYPIAAATLFFGSAEPDKVLVAGQMDESQNVDLQAAAVLSFPPTSKIMPAKDPNNPEMTVKLPGAGTATLSFGMVVESEEETTVVGTKGRLTIKTPAHCPTKLTLKLKSDGRGNIGEETFEYPLPEEIEEVKAAGGFFYPNSTGFMYEAAAVARCIAAGKTEAPQFTLKETMLNLKIIEQIRKQLGLPPVVPS